jgi:serine/threonine protein kinase
MEEKPGMRFGNYELVRRIDIGGMGEVYLAHQLTAFGRPVAIKIIRLDLVHDITARARFLREAEVSAYLKHEHILPLYDFGDVDGRLFLATPYIEGGTLATRLKNRGPLSLTDTHKLFVPLVQAVAYIHRRGIIHRDLKPTNILLDSEDGEIYVRLIDFGIASLQGHNASPSLTTAGQEMGTVAYMAPERLSGIAAPSNDIFSLGVILHQMLTTYMPTTTPASPPSVVPRLPEPLAQVVRRCIATNPAERYATAEELLKGFEQAYQQVSSQAKPGTPPADPGTSALVTNRLELDLPELVPGPVPIPRSEKVSLSHSGEIAALVPEKPAQIASRPPTPRRFVPEDYNAPTTSFHVSQPPEYRQPSTHRPPLIRPPKQRLQLQGKKNPLLLIISLITVVVLLVIGGMLLYGYQIVFAASVSVNFTPQTRTISQIFALKADPNAKTVNLTQATIPGLPLSYSQTMNRSGATHGQVNCLPFVGCQQAVSQDDVDTLASQMEPVLEQNITQELQGKISVAHGIQIGQIQFSDPTVSPDPPVGTPNKTVTVTVTETGSVGYIRTADSTMVVHYELNAAVARMGSGFQMVESTVTIGHPTTQSTDSTTGITTINVPAGAVALYKFSQTQLQQISNGLVGKSLAQAQAFLKSQQGIDPTSISIHFTTGSGSTMPSDTQHIKLIPLPPTKLPNVSLTRTSETTPAEITPTATFIESGN